MYGTFLLSPATKDASLVEDDQFKISLDVLLSHIPSYHVSNSSSSSLKAIMAVA
jgi:hypothetical protein